MVSARYECGVRCLSLLPTRVPFPLILAENCPYAHGNVELRQITLEERERKKLIPSARKYKTQLCEKWISTVRWVPFVGSPLQHRRAYISVITSSYAVTSPPRSCVTQGTCPYSDRCTFCHDYRLAASPAVLADLWDATKVLGSAGGSAHTGVL